MAFGSPLFRGALHSDQGRREVHRYLEERGGQKGPVLWCLEHGDVFQLTSRGSEGTHVTRTDAAFDTLSWSVEDLSNDTFLSATRERNTIGVHGRLNGKPIDKTVALDNDPWFQATSLSLRAFVVSEQQTIRFWTLRSNTLKPYKLQATKQGVEVMTADGRQTEAVRVELRLTGWKAPFWASHYWYRRVDGLLLRYEGVGDAAGSFNVTISYIGSGQRCELPADALPVDQPLDPHAGS